MLGRVREQRHGVCGLGRVSDRHAYVHVLLESSGGENERSVRWRGAVREARGGRGVVCV